jgi:signal transduction histidine kinase
VSSIDPIAAGRGAAADGVTRTMAVALGVAAVLFSIVGSGAFLTQWGVAHPAWTVGTALGIFAPLLIGAALASAAPVALLRGLAATSAVAQLAGLALYVPALPLGFLPERYETPWLLLVTAAGTTAAAVAWSAPVAVGYLVLSVSLYTIDRIIGTPYVTLAYLVQDSLYTLLFGLVFVILAIATHRAGRTLDDAAEAAIADTRASASHDARGRERSRIEALLHDSVLVALLASARDARRSPEEARSALTQLDQLAQEIPAPPPTPEAWIWRLQSLTTDLAPNARFTFENDHRIEPLPVEPALAVLEATAEALRNSVAHAGTATRAVHARATPFGLEVTVLDDGSGFDPDAVRPERLGVRVSILDRMRSLAGGHAHIVSRPGVGTRIVISWLAS